MLFCLSLCTINYTTVGPDFIFHSSVILGHLYYAYEITLDIEDSLCP